jgi:hypothetical protein
MKKEAPRRHLVAIVDRHAGSPLLDDARKDKRASDESRYRARTYGRVDVILKSIESMPVARRRAPQRSNNLLLCRSRQTNRSHSCFSSQAYDHHRCQPYQPWRRQQQK